MDEVTIKRVAAQYGLTVRKVSQPQKGYRNISYALELDIGRLANLILYKHEAGITSLIRRANQIGNYLHSCGLPARRTLDPRLTKLQSSQQTRYCSIYNYLPGQTIPWEAYTMDHIKLLGKTMSMMHGALRFYKPGHRLPDQCRQLQALVVEMMDYFADGGVRRAVTKKLNLQLVNNCFDDALDVLALCQRLPGQHALHMDFVRGNVLFEDEPQLGVSGILDFEKAARGPAILDVARTLAFLLVDCKYKAEEKVRKYFLESGYQKRGSVKLSDEQLQYLEQLIDLFLLHDFYKFLAHNPYESLAQNEHYKRTQALLVRRQVVAKST